MSFFEVPVITELPLAPLFPQQRKILRVMRRFASERSVGSPSEITSAANYSVFLLRARSRETNNHNRRKRSLNLNTGVGYIGGAGTRGADEF